MATRDEFYTALQFMTRLPVPRDTEHSDQSFARSARFYPAVGLVVGAIAGLAYFLLGQVFPENVATFMCIVVAVAVTGALHEDGLADVADGLGANNRERRLEIMRDSRIGSYGVLALIFAVGIKAAILAGLPGPGMALGAFVAADPDFDGLLDHLQSMLDILLPRYEKEGKSYLTIAIGCTGGRHRSVTVAERIWSDLAMRDDVVVSVSHRDLD